MPVLGVFVATLLTISCVRGPRKGERPVAGKAESRTRTSVGVDKPAGVGTAQSHPSMTRTGTVEKRGCEVSFYHEQLVVDCSFTPCPADAVASLVALQDVSLQPGKQGWTVTGRRPSPPLSPKIGQLSGSGGNWYLDLHGTTKQAICNVGAENLSVLEDADTTLQLVGIQVRQTYMPNSFSP